jgi:predicted secreted protein
MHLYNCIWVVLLVSRLNLAFISPKLSHGIDIMLVCLCPCRFDNPRNTVRWKLLQLASVHLRIILFGLRTANREKNLQRTWSGSETRSTGANLRTGNENEAERKIKTEINRGFNQFNEEHLISGSSASQAQSKMASTHKIRNQFYQCNPNNIYKRSTEVATLPPSFDLLQSKVVHDTLTLI